MNTEAQLKEMHAAANRQFQSAKLAADNNSAGIEIATRQAAALEKEIEAATQAFVDAWLTHELDGGPPPDAGVIKLQEKLGLVALLKGRLVLKDPYVRAASLEAESRLCFISSKCLIKISEIEEEKAQAAIEQIGPALGAGASILIENSKFQEIKRQAGAMAEEAQRLSVQAAQLIESVKGN